MQHGCSKDSDCAEDICHYGECLLKPGDPLPKKIDSDYKSDDDLRHYCATEDVYTDEHGIRRCAWSMGSDCSKDALICGEDCSCRDGICKLNPRVLTRGKACKSDSDCARGFCSRGECLLKSGEQTDSGYHCVEYDRTYDDNGILRCAWPAGTDCSKDSRICGDRKDLQCVDGTCKRRVELGNDCQSDDECIQGTCQLYDESLYMDPGHHCLLNPGEPTVDSRFCASGNIYEDGDLLRCLSKDCDQYPEHCGNVICKDGFCGPLLGYSCEL